MQGSISTLNVGEGDFTITFDGHDDIELEKALGMLSDMQKRGYAILVQQADGSYARAHAIDRETKSYIVSVPIAAATVDHVKLEAPSKLTPPPEFTEEGQSDTPRSGGLRGDAGEAVTFEADVQAPAADTPKRRGRPAKERQPVASSKAVAVGRSAGG